MKKGRILALVLIGLLMVSGLVFVGCDDKAAGSAAGSSCDEKGLCYFNNYTYQGLFCNQKRCAVSISDATRCDCP